MNNQAQIGFLSVLFILVCFFALYAWQPLEPSIEVAKQSDENAICDCPCSLHTVEIAAPNTLKYDNQLMTIEEIIVAIRDSECLMDVVVSAEDDIEYQESLAVTYQIVQALPHKKVRWAGKP